MLALVETPVYSVVYLYGFADIPRTQFYTYTIMYNLYIKLYIPITDI